MQIAAELALSPVGGELALRAPPPGGPSRLPRLQARPSLVPTGGPATPRATRGPRRPPQDPPAAPGTPERRLPEADAHPGVLKDPRLPGGPADPPAWPWAPGESEREEGPQAEPTQKIIPPSLRDPAFPIPWLTPNRNSCGTRSGWCLQARKPAPPALCARVNQERTAQGPRRLYLRMSCPPGPS